MSVERLLHWRIVFGIGCILLGGLLIFALLPVNTGVIKFLPGATGIAIGLLSIMFDFLG